MPNTPDYDYIARTKAKHLAQSLASTKQSVASRQLAAAQELEEALQQIGARNSGQVLTTGAVTGTLAWDDTVNALNNSTHTLQEETPNYAILKTEIAGLRAEIEKLKEEIRTPIVF
jgi:hypothetical protein